MSTQNPGLLEAVAADGRPLLQITAFALFFSGCFALFLSIRREFLPHDVTFLGMTPDQLCAIAECRVVAFMFHDRVAFGGVLLRASAPPSVCTRPSATRTGSTSRRQSRGASSS